MKILKKIISFFNKKEDIPTEWSNFLDTKNSWKGLNSLTDSTTLLFRGLKDTQVDSHLHECSDESGYVVEGKIELTTDLGTFIFVAGEGYFVKRNTLHTVKFLKDSTLLVVFTPKMEKFNINFK